jgi:Spy/CpxP family protein refolding chaperone
MAERLKLTDDQKAKLRPIYQEEMTKTREVRQDTSLTTEQRRDKMRDLRQEYLGKMKPILTADQYDDLKKMREQGAGRGPRGVRQGGDAKPPAAPDNTGNNKQQ